MISAGFLNRVRFYSSTTGTGAVTAGSAYSSAFLTPPAAGAVDGKSYTWLITDGNNIEIVDGAWSASGGSFARTNVRLSINGGTAGTSLLSLSGNEVCEIIVAAEDLDWLDFAEQSIASAATADLSTVNQSRVAITGTTTITSLGAGANLVRFVRFAGALLLTYNATSLILPGAANITTAAGDMALFASDPSGNWRCLFYLCASGKSVVLPASADITDSTALGRALIISARAAISDANYSVAAGISVAAYTSITAARAVTLPAASSYAAGQQLLVVDESGSCSATKTITLNRAGSDTINGATSAAISTPYGFIAIESNGSNAWTIVDQSTLSMAQQAASAVAITGGSLAGVSLALARQAVSDANYSVAAGIGLAAYTAITAARAVTLPAASSYAAGQQLLVVDESGSCSATKTITLNPAGSDTINGATSAVINSAYGYLVLESNGSNAWTIVDQAIWHEADDYGKFSSLTPAWNYSIAVAAASNNLTVTINDKDGNAPSTTSPIVVNFRSATAVTGTSVQRKSTSALSFTINSGNTLGTANNQPFRLHLALFDDAGTLVLGAMCAVVGGASPSNIVGIDESQLLNTQSGTNGGSTAGVWYAATDLSSGGPYAMRYLGFIECNSTSFTAGTWGTSGTGLISKAQLGGPGVPRPGQQVQRVYASGANQTSLNGTTKVSNRNLAITPTSAASIIVARAFVAIRSSDTSDLISAQLSRGSSFTGIGNIRSVLGGVSARRRADHPGLGRDSRRRDAQSAARRPDHDAARDGGLDRADRGAPGRR